MENILADYVFNQTHYLGDFNTGHFIDRAWKNFKGIYNGKEH